MSFVSVDLFTENNDLIKIENNQEYPELSDIGNVKFVLLTIFRKRRNSQERQNFTFIHQRITHRHCLHSLLIVLI